MKSTLISTISSGASTGSNALNPVHIAYLKGSSQPVTVFTDGGSNASYITQACAERHKLRKVKTVSLAISTVGGSKKNHRSSIFEVTIVTMDKKIVTVEAYSLPVITKPTVPVNKRILESLFPTSR